MTWQEYNIGLQPLINKFGSIKYTTEYITSNYFYWKDKPQSWLMDLVTEYVMLNQQLELKPQVKNQAKASTTEQHIAFMDNLEISDGYLEKLLKDNDCSNLTELVLKNVKNTV